jgi:hypothetical protein
MIKSEKIPSLEELKKMNESSNTNKDDAITAQVHVEKTLDIVEKLVKEKLFDVAWVNTLKDLLSDLSKVQ